MRLLLQFAEKRTKIPPERLDLHDLDAEVISSFLDHLEHERRNTIGNTESTPARSTRSTDSRVYATQNTPTSSRASWRSLPSATSAP